MFGAGIQRGGGFIENQDRCVAHDGAGNGQALALAGGQFAAALAQFGVVAVGQRLNKFVSTGHPGGGLDIVATDIDGGITDIFLERQGKQADDPPGET